MKSLITALILFTCATAQAQFGNCVSCGRWEPRNFKSKLGLVADWDFGRPSLVTLNGAGISRIEDRVGTNALLQSTAAAQPLISRTDNSGNLLVQSEALTNSIWQKIKGGSALLPVVTENYGPDGTYPTADRVVYSLNGASTASDFSQLEQDTVVVSSGTWNTSFFIRSTDGSSTYYVYAAAETAVNSGTNYYSTVSVNGSWQQVVLTTVLTNQSAINVKVRLRGAQTPTNSPTADVMLARFNVYNSTWSTNYIATTSTIAVPGLQGRATAYFDGSAHYLKAAAFTLNQPETVVWLGRQVTWTDADSILDGNTTGSGRYYQRTASPGTRLSSDNGNHFFDDASSFPVGEWHPATVVFNGTSSSVQIDKKTVTTGDAGVGAMGGFTLSASGGGTGLGNLQVQRVLLSNKSLATNELEFLRWGPLKYAGVK